MDKQAAQKSWILALPLSVKTFALAYIGMAATLCALLSYIWNNRLDYSFGYIVPLFVAYILFDRASKIRDYFNPSAETVAVKNNKFLEGGLNLFFGAILLFCLFGYVFFAWLFYLTQNRGTPAFATTFCFAFAAYSMVYFASSTDSNGGAKSISERLKFLSLFTFPCFVWIVAAPTFSAIEEKISLFLLGIVADVVYNIMDIFGYIVTLRGNALEFPNGSVGVAEACSGIRSLTACLFAGSFLAAAMLNRLWEKVALVILSMFFAFFNNLLRALFLALWAYEYGSDAISGFVHDAAGYFVLGTTVIGLLIFIKIFEFNPIPKEFREQNQK